MKKIIEYAGKKTDKAKDAVGGLLGGVGEAPAVWQREEK